MSLEKERFHNAARDGYLDLLREATRRDCNASDEDGMTPTLISAYWGHLDALRLLVGRGGDPEKCDHLGATALHWSAANGHIDCVSFLVNFGVNLWALDNDFHTAKDLAAINQREQILDFLDQAMARQSALNTKMVQKLKEKSIVETEKRIKQFQKLQKKATKKAEKEEKMLRKRLSMTTDDLMIIDRSTAIVGGQREQRFSDLVNTHHHSYTNNRQGSHGTINLSNLQNTATSKLKAKIGIGAVSRKVLNRKTSNSQQSGDSISLSSQFKISQISAEDGKKSIRSLTGLRRPDNQILYVPKYDTNSLSSRYGPSSSSQGSICSQTHLHDSNVSPGQRKGIPLREMFNPPTSRLSRAISEPEYLNHAGADSGFEDHRPHQAHYETEGSMFERPGFGSVAFRKNLVSLPSKQEKVPSREIIEEDTETITGTERLSNREAGSDSIGSAGSLATRNAFMSNTSSWDEDDRDCAIDEDDEEGYEDDEDDDGTWPVCLFLAAHGMHQFIPLFKKEKIDLEALMLLNEEDFKSLGLPLGPRRKLLQAINIRKNAIQKPGLIQDTHL